MPLPAFVPVSPGFSYLWNMEMQYEPSLRHTAARVLVTAVDTRDETEPWVCYLVEGEPCRLTCCRLGHFRASVIADPAGAWASQAVIREAIAQTEANIQTSTIPGVYDFLAHRRPDGWLSPGSPTV